MIRKSTSTPATGTLSKLLGAAFVTLAAAASAQATTIIDFNKFNTLVGHNDAFMEEGYLLAGLSNVGGAGHGDFVGAVLDGSDPFSCFSGTCPVNNPTPYYATLNDGLFYLAGAAGQTFQIKGFDASFIGDNSTSYPAVAGLLRIQGFYADNTWKSETYQLAGPKAGSGFQFAHYTPSAAFSTSNFVEAYFFGFTCNTAGSCSAFSTDRGQFAIDNIEIPEPGTGLLLGLGLIGMGAFARRRAA